MKRAAIFYGLLAAALLVSLGGRLARADEAIEHYERAIAIKPDYADAHINLDTALRAASLSGSP